MKLQPFQSEVVSIFINSGSYISNNFVFEGMKWSKQYLRIKNDVDLFHTSGDIPYMTIAYTVNYNLYFCYYTALEFGKYFIPFSFYLHNIFIFIFVVFIQNPLLY